MQRLSTPEPAAIPESVEPAAPGQDYTVKAGAAPLWDISGSYPSSPWFWPKLWSYNPQIPNPNWIYPGNQIHFAPSGNAQLSTEAPPPEPQLRNDEDVTLTGKIGYTPSSATLIQSEGFITATELAASGSIVGSSEEKSLLSSLDSVYIKFGKSSPQPGDRFLVFRTVREVRHPVTGNFFGDYLTGFARDGEDHGPGYAPHFRDHRPQLQYHRARRSGRPVGREIPAQCGPQAKRTRSRRLHRLPQR